MAWLLMMLVGCGGVGNDKTSFEACLSTQRLYCDCELNSYCVEESLWESGCEEFDSTVCDTSSQNFNADDCESYHKDVPPELLDYQNCYNQHLSETCSPDGNKAACKEEYDAYLEGR